MWYRQVFRRQTKRVYTEDMADDKQQDTRSLEIIRDQRILDNIMVLAFFEKGSAEAKSALQVILRTLLSDPGLTVMDYQAEYPLQNIGHHGVRIDVWARDGNGRQLALELQKVTNAEVYPRAVFEASTMVVHSLPAGVRYDRVDDVIVIFFTEEDLEGEGEPLYMYRTTRENKPDRLMPKAPAYLYVNGQYHNNTTELGRIISDIMEPDPAHMQTPVLRERMNMLKNTVEGSEKMGEALEEYVQQRAERYAADSNRQLLLELVRKGALALKDAAESLSIPEAELRLELAGSPETIE